MSIAAQTHDMTPPERWTNTVRTVWRFISKEHATRAYELFIAPFYGELNNRWYHTVDHVMYILHQLDMRVDRYDAVWELAAWFHDTITSSIPNRYSHRLLASLTPTHPVGTAQRVVPEIQSAVLLQGANTYMNMMAKDGRPSIIDTPVPMDVERALAMILATQTSVYTRNAVAADLRTKQFVDADMSILGADETTYDAYCIAVRKEYPQVSDADWAMGRSKFLIMLLDRGPIYFTDEFADLEEPARRNIECELSRYIA